MLKCSKASYIFFIENIRQAPFSFSTPQLNKSWIKLKPTYVEAQGPQCFGIGCHLSCLGQPIGRILATFTGCHAVELMVTSYEDSHTRLLKSIKVDLGHTLVWTENKNFGDYHRRLMTTKVCKGWLLHPCSLNDILKSQPTSMWSSFTVAPVFFWNWIEQFANSFWGEKAHNVIFS